MRRVLRLCLLGLRGIARSQIFSFINCAYKGKMYHQLHMLILVCLYLSVGQSVTGYRMGIGNPLSDLPGKKKPQTSSRAFNIAAFTPA